MVDITNLVGNLGVKRSPEGSPPGPILFCVSMKDLTDNLVFADPYLLEMELEAIDRNYWQLQDDLQSVDHWVSVNHMEHAIERFSKTVLTKGR